MTSKAHGDDDDGGGGGGGDDDDIFFNIFYIAQFSIPEQTHCALVASDFEWWWWW